MFSPFGLSHGSGRYIGLVWFITSLLACSAIAQEVYFTPGDKCADVICREIEGAKSNVCVQAYTFTSAQIRRSLTDAKARGVQVIVILDKSQRNGRSVQQLWMVKKGVTMLVDTNHAVAHNKVIIIDQKTVITGSYNFTEAAEKSNAENVLILRDPAVTAKYMSNWTAHIQHSIPFQPTAKAGDFIRH
jgi:phosphatidylserine/phosphatidylglycerophosphate/cardiolipin synthase-like enzyme